ncbi:MAG: hypothetical protein QXR62_06270 [Candidatus Bathyarchaeia archaeon]
MDIELYVVGNRIVFHKYRVNCKVPEPPREPMKPHELRETLYWKFRQKLAKYRVEPYGILCDDEQQLAEVEAILKELGIPYTVDDISPTPELLAKAREIDGKVGNRSEALKYIMGENHSSGTSP